LHIGGYKQKSVYTVTTLDSVFPLEIKVANTEQIRGPTLRTDQSNISIHYSR